MCIEIVIGLCSPQSLLGVLPDGLFALEGMRPVKLASLLDHAVLADRIRTTSVVIGREPKKQNQAKSATTANAVNLVPIDESANLTASALGNRPRQGGTAILERGL